jgi:hypothetical protein
MNRDEILQVIYFDIASEGGESTWIGFERPSRCLADTRRQYGIRTNVRPNVQKYLSSASVQTMLKLSYQPTVNALALRQCVGAHLSSEQFDEEIPRGRATLLRPRRRLFRGRQSGCLYP